MQVPGGYMGRLLWVDLTTGRSWCEELPASVWHHYLGGTGLGAYLLWRQGTFPAPLDPDALLIFATGPLTGTRAPTAGKCAIVARSPLTGQWGEADVGGRLATGLKSCGYDALVVTGRSAAPVYIAVSADGASLRPAGGLWGLDTYGTCDRIRAETAANATVAAIGLAGERQLPLAAIMVDGRDARAAGRGGLGAVMGAKGLKAVAAVRGSRATPVADPAGLAAVLKAVLPEVVARTARQKEFGTAGGVVANAAIADMSARNWTRGDWVEPAEQIGGERMSATILEKNYYCDRCVIGCGRVVAVRRGPYAGKGVGGPEYETLAGFGAQLLIADLDAITELNDLCNRHGIDTISTAHVLAMGMEAREQGLITAPGSELLRWGDADAAVRLVNQIVRGEGIGGFLGQGTRAMAAQLGPAAAVMAIEVGGLELPFHDPRALSSLAVGYVTHPRGGCHRTCTHYMDRYAFPDLGWDKPFDRHGTAGKGRAAARLQDYAEVFTNAKLCQIELSAVTPSALARMLSAVTGWSVDVPGLLLMGERSFNLKWLYNRRLGGGPAQRRLPRRLTEQPFAAGGSAGYLPQVEPMLAEYYAARGWDPDGRPRPETLVRLGLPPMG